MQKSIQQSFMYIFLIIIICIPNTLFAEDITMTAIGEYAMGDNDTYIEAKKLALQDAKRNLLEKVGTYIESKTEVKDGIVKSDEINQYTAGIVKVEEIGDEKVLANKATLVKVNVKAIVNPDVLIKQIISFRNRQDIEESAKKLSIDNSKLRQEIEQLSQQLRNVVDENQYRQLNTQRKEILEQIDMNEKGLTLLLNGKELYSAALLDRQRKDEAKNNVKNIIKKIASSYRLSASDIEVDENGDGTVTVTFEVAAHIPFELAAKPLSQYNSYHRVNFDDVKSSDIESTGLYFYSQEAGPEGIYKRLSSDYGVIKISASSNKYYEAKKFMESELQTLFLHVAMRFSGFYTNKYLIREELYSKDLIGRWSLKPDFKKTCRVKMPLSELKSLSQLKLKIVYDSEEYGQQSSSIKR